MFEWTSLLIDLDFLPVFLLKVSVLLSAAWLVHTVVKRRNPRWRVLLWRGVFVALIVLPFAQWSLPNLDLEVAVQPEPPAESFIAEPAYTDRAVEYTEAAVAPIDIPEQQPLLESEVPLPITRETKFEFNASTWAVLWAIGFGLMLLQMGLVLRRLRRQLAQSAEAPSDITSAAESIAKHLGVNTPPLVRTIDRDGSPYLTGLWRSIIVLPNRCLRSESASRLPAILAHEIAHAKSRDIAWMAIARFISSVLWFHPLMWRVRNAHNAACEEVCDGIAAEYVGSAKGYSKALAQEALAVQSAQRLQVGVPMVRRGGIIDRLRKIERGIRTNPIARKWLAACILVAMISLVGLGSLRLVEAKAVETKYPHVIPIETYATSWSAFQPGDTIEIVEVRGTQPNFEKGEYYYVRGTYTLTSHDRALLHVYATNGEVEATQGSPVSKGMGDFVRTFKLTKNGMPHVSFYPANGGDGFGDRYFRRTIKQSEAIPSEPLPPIEVDVSRDDNVVRLPGVDVKLLASLLPTGELLSPRGIAIGPESIGSTLSKYGFKEELFSGFPPKNSSDRRSNVAVVDGTQNPKNGLGLIFHLQPTQETERHSSRRATLGKVQLIETNSKSDPYTGLYSGKLVRYFWDDVASEDGFVTVQTDISLGKPLEQIADIPRDAHEWAFELDGRKLIATVERGAHAIQEEAYRVTVKLVEGEPLPNYQVVAVEYDGPTVTSGINTKTLLEPGEEWTWEFPSYLFNPIEEIARFQFIGHQLQPIIWRNVALTAQAIESGGATAARSDAEAPSPIEVDVSKVEPIVRFPRVDVKLLATLASPRELLSPQGVPIAPDSLGSSAKNIIAQFQAASHLHEGKLGLLFYVEPTQGPDRNLRGPLFSGVHLWEPGSEIVLSPGTSSLYFEDGEAVDSSFQLWVLDYVPSRTRNVNIQMDALYGRRTDYTADIPITARDFEIDVDGRTLFATVERRSREGKDDASYVTLRFGNGRPIPNFHVEVMAVEDYGRKVESFTSSRMPIGPGSFMPRTARTWAFHDIPHTPVDEIAKYHFIGRTRQPIIWRNVALTPLVAPKDEPV